MPFTEKTDQNTDSKKPISYWWVLVFYLISFLFLFLDILSPFNALLLIIIFIMAISAYNKQQGKNKTETKWPLFVVGLCLPSSLISSFFIFLSIINSINSTGYYSLFSLFEILFFLLPPYFLSNLFSSIWFLRRKGDSLGNKTKKNIATINIILIVVDIFFTPLYIIFALFVSEKATLVIIGVFLILIVMLNLLSYILHFFNEKNTG